MEKKSKNYRPTLAELDSLAEFYRQEEEKPEIYDKELKEYSSDRVSPFGEFDVEALVDAFDGLQQKRREEFCCIVTRWAREENAAHEIDNS